MSAQTNTGKMQEKRTYSLKCGRRCAIVEIQIFIRNTSLTNSYNHKTTIKLFYAVPNISQP